ncbi:hypothetical protein DM860_007486 [Cuscuta australis]|uniref:Uncharacterized protein n=1 Tax=Cuscuta australis TaxID=267555 RepID=A0A328E7U1_9ASTE|nr:hypothetical protein DM860_007486 [Cuscuta australis]
MNSEETERRRSTGKDDDDDDDIRKGMKKGEKKETFKGMDGKQSKIQGIAIVSTSPALPPPSQSSSATTAIVSPTTTAPCFDHLRPSPRRHRQPCLSLAPATTINPTFAIAPATTVSPTFALAPAATVIPTFASALSPPSAVVTSRSARSER